MKSDIEIASSVNLLPIEEVAASLGIEKDALEFYGKYKAKVDVKEKMKGKLILVTAINPTSAGEGKTTVSIGLADGLKQKFKSVCLALREPSLGPVFGIKGGAAGGGYAQIAPMEDINLHFTGDLHAITSANNLLSAMIDNHIYWGNNLKIKIITWRRCMDMNDRALRNTVIGLGFNVREDGFDITAASEIMAILCLSKDKNDLKVRLGNIVIGQNDNGENIAARQLNADEAMAILLKDAIKPNLVQTLEGVPAFVHGGPFANIAHGCNSIIATKSALTCADYVVTEAGFGADLGAEKFLDIKCRVAGISPAVVVLVATIRALKNLGGKKDNLSELDMNALEMGLPNLLKHIENITKNFNLKCVVAINKFVTDIDEEIDFVRNACKKFNADVVPIECWANGGKGSVELAEHVIKVLSFPTDELKFTYELSDSIEEKIEKVAKNIYGANGVKFSDKAKKVMEKLNKSEFKNLPVCIAKTQYSLSDNPLLLGRPKEFDITVKDIVLRAGAGFLVAISGDILLMPGLPKVPNAEKMTIIDDKISGLF